jgi:hypothetical protein
MATTWTDTTADDGDVLIAPGRRNVTLDEVRDRALQPLARMIASMCDWGAAGADGRIGDVRFLAANFALSDNLGFYVQILTEPGEPVLAEAVSGALHQPIRAFMTPTRRKALASLGYRVGGGARNFQKEWRVTDPAAASGLAAELLGILFEVYGYRGRQPLRVSRHSDARSHTGAVLSAVTVDDVRKMAAGVGITAAPFVPAGIPARDRRSGAARLLRVSEPFSFYLEMCAPTRRCKGWFHGVGFRAGFGGTSRVPDARLVEIAGQVPFARLHRDSDGDVLLFWDLALTGATQEYFTGALKEWLWLWMKVSTLLEQSTPARGRPNRKPARAEAADEPGLDEEIEPPARPTKMILH